MISPALAMALLSTHAIFMWEFLDYYLKPVKYVSELNQVPALDNLLYHAVHYGVARNQTRGFCAMQTSE